MDCEYCGKEIKHVDCLYTWLHNKCADEWDRRKDARLCVMCCEPLPDDIPSMGPGAHRHQECIDGGMWIGYDSL